MLAPPSPLSASASPHLLPPLLDIARLGPRGAIMTEHRTDQPHPLFSRKGTFPSPGPGRSTIGRVDCMEGYTHATRSASPDLRRGCACTRNLTEITTTHSPRNKSCVCPTRTLLSCPAAATSRRDTRCWSFHHVLVYLPCAPAHLLTGFVCLPACHHVRTHLRRLQIEKGYSEGPGPARLLMGRTVPQKLIWMPSFSSKKKKNPPQSTQL